ncbi:MAG: hypothetical protein H0W30_01045 [Gemmatimonadaceae bacterium]|nr:hypothetical protein [Gemmatimonadaceae bacterium]MBA3557161.1 hypothetical protein [Gemmatimonadaceae bacterium]
MSIPLLIGLLVMAILIAAAAGVWRARTKDAGTTQSSVMVLLLVAGAAMLVFYLLHGGF